MQNHASNQHIASLDGFRGLAVLMVVFFHCLVVSTGGRGIAIELIGNLSRSGWLGVEMFFALSGFLITGILLKTVERPQYFRNFYIRRTLRIFPLYYAVISICFGLAFLWHLAGREYAPQYLLYVQNFLPESAAHLGSHFRLIHFWSLAVEEQFYLFWPLVVWFTRKRPHIFMAICIAIVLQGPFVRGIAISQGIPYPRLYFWTPFRLDSLVWGALAAVSLKLLSEKHLNVFRIGTLYLGAVLLLLIFVDVKGILGWLNPVALIVGNWSMAMLSCGILLTLVTRHSLFSKFFAFSPLRWFGKYSYGVYVYHYLFPDLNSYIRKFVLVHTGSVPLSAMAFIASFFIIGSTFALISYHGFEKHFLRLKDVLAPEAVAARRTVELV